MTRTRIHFCRLTLIAVVGLLVVSNVWAQREQVRNWAAPLYWQPSAREAALIKQARQAQPEAVDAAAASTPDQVAGYPSPLVFVAITPCRMMDTRGYDATFTGVYGPPAMAANGSRSLPVAGVTAGYCEVPSTAQAVSINVTLWPNVGSPVSYLTIWPTGSTFPTVSTMNDTEGVQGVSNGAVAALGTGGAFSFYVTNATNLFIDVNGYYASIGDAYWNTTLGIGALQNNIGVDNTAFGNAALQYNTSGGNTTASGYDALWQNTTGSANTAVGAAALQLNTTGSTNTATGVGALELNTTGGGNTSTGAGALEYNTTGSWNIASGESAMYSNTTGAGNTAIGYWTLFSNSTGSYNIAVGYQAADNVSNGNNNIHIGTKGSSGDNGTIRIGGNTAFGDAVQTQFFASGIRGTTTVNSDAIPVLVDSAGQLGTASSSRTVKRDIEDMGDTTGTLMSLRPVSFRYKVHGPDSPLQYGLVAEEVAEVAPDLVARNEDGEIETVFYDKVNAMLLNQVQTQQRLIEAQKEELQSRTERLTGQVQAQGDLIRRLESRLAEIENRVK